MLQLKSLRTQLDAVKRYNSAKSRKTNSAEIRYCREKAVIFNSITDWFTAILTIVLQLDVMSMRSRHAMQVSRGTQKVDRCAIVQCI